MYYVEARADNSEYANHRVICLVVVGSSFDSEQISKFQMDTFDRFREMDSDKKLNLKFNLKLNRPRRWRWRWSDDNSLTFFLRKVELKR